VAARGEALRIVRSLGTTAGADAAALPARPDLAALGPEALESALVEIRYEGYIGRQTRAVERASRNEHLALTDEIASQPLQGMSREGHEKIKRFKPATVGQAARLPGFSPADVAVLIIYAERERRRVGAQSPA
jgi:tRNA U34 5-carboxymethylaminomethyl modifying enzyme MnmG/GidA